MQLLSGHVQGINNDHKVCVIGDYLKSLNPKFDAFCLQEHKLGGDKVERTSKVLWRKYAFPTLKASLSNDDEVRRVSTIKGGISTCI